MFVTDLTRMRRASDTKISLKKKLHTLKRMVQVKRMKKMRGKKKHVQVKFSEVKQNLNSIISFVNSNQHYNKYYLMMREMRQDTVKEHRKEEHKPK
jgi:hypothetical protein